MASAHVIESRQILFFCEIKRRRFDCGKNTTRLWFFNLTTSDSIAPFFSKGEKQEEEDFLWFVALVYRVVYC